jgi:signal transduction histidine kinase
MLTRRSGLVYGTLLAIWIILIGWQVAEHLRVRRSARSALRHRAEDISGTLALIMRSQRLFASSNRVEAVLSELVKQGEVYSIQLFNAAGEELVSAGAPIELPKSGLSGSEYWDEKANTLTLINPVNLPTNIIVNFNELSSNRPPRMEPSPDGPPPDGPPPGPPPTNFASAEISGTNGLAGTNGPGGPRPGFRRPRLSAEEFKALSEKKGTHGFIMVMSAQALSAAVNRDFWMRAFIGLLATISVAGYGLAWTSAARTSELQIRLVRASELNMHLKEMNLAAAGLAHETRNPLNIVRGLAQMISKQEDASPEIRLKSKEIINESDRVAAQLNEFINYSRPREVRRAATRLMSVVGEVTRALNYDIEEKKVRVENSAEELLIQADEQLLRQALFNLVLNAIQAVQTNGEIRIRAGKQGNTDAYIEISDNGPGVAPEHRSEIFKPYFTTHEEGTGLGLAVVQQIVLAHGWEIQCQPNQPKGASFRISHIKLAMKT